MAKFVTFGFDDRVIGTLGVKDGEFTATGAQPEQVLEFAKHGRQMQEQEFPGKEPAPEDVMARMVRTMQGRCHAVWSDAEGNPLPDQNG